jgi:hypothetical protein
MHYLSVKPGPIADHVHAVGATDDERALYRKQGHTDWTSTLLARASEMVDGGRLVVANLCVNEHGHYIGSTGGSCMFDTLTTHWRNLAATGAITDTEYRAATFQMYYQTPQEYSAPFDDPNSPVSRAGLRLDRVSTVITPCPFAAIFREQRDATAYARSYVPSIRSWSESTFQGALDSNRPPEERAAILNRLYEAYEADVTAAPTSHWKDYVHCLLSVSKTRA